MWTWPVFVSVFGSIMLFFLFHLVIDLINNPRKEFTYDLTGIGISLFQLPTFWLTVLITVVLSLGPRFIHHALNELFNPSDHNIIREREIFKLEDFREYPSQDNEYSDILQPALEKSPVSN